MNSLLASNAKTQQTERRISELEQKYGISQAETEQPQELGKPQPKITREEYDVIKSVFERLGCDSLITYSDFFSNFIGFSYEQFFRNQPKVVQALCYYMNDQTTGNSERSQIRSYINNLETVSEVLYLIAENNAIFEETEILCNALNEAHTQYL